MKRMTNYAVVDTVAETIVSVFPAVNDMVADRLYKKAVEKVGDVVKPDYSLIKTNSSFDFPETFTEVKEIEGTDIYVGDDNE